MVKGAPFWCVLLGIGQGSILVNIGALFWYGFWLMDVSPETALAKPPPGCPLYFVDASRILTPIYTMIGFMLTLGATIVFLSFGTFSLLLTSHALRRAALLAAERTAPVKAAAAGA